MTSPAVAGRVAPRTKEAVSAAVWCGLGIAVLVVGLIRLRLLNVPFERDEGEYAYAGQLILSGVPPYTLLYNMKLPGTYLMYAVSMLFFGKTIIGARLGLLLVTSATCIGVFQLARRFVPAKDSLASAASYAVLALSTEMLGPFGHATHYVALFGLWGLVILADAMERQNGKRFFVAGILFGAAVLMKQPGAVFLACAGTWIAFGPSASKVWKFAIVLMGAVTPLGLLAIWLLLSGAFGQVWFWVFQYGQAYGGQQQLAEGWDNLRLAASRFLPQAGVLWLLTAGGVALLFTRRYPAPTRLRAGSFLLLSFLGVCPGLYFREHYFLLLLPAAAMAVGLAVATIRSTPAMGRWLAPALVIVACSQALYVQRGILLGAAPEEVSRLVYGPDLFPESVPIARYLQDRTRPDDRLVVFGSEPQIFFYANRRSATGFVYMYPLMERHPHARRMQEMMIREIEERRPAYAVLIKTPTSWLERPDSDHTMQDWAVRYLDEHYAIAGQVVVSDEGTRYFWDAVAAQQPITETTQALVLRRRDFVPVR